ncbi:hypothetical protein [Cerasicoccus fimbriatus]|uniref:hypothetical protein n=1 Tax=Cerasicoccus fimbriatus TaxID=3014554 RepID=UPI0022B55D5D|nr:hypothetical protein [Cerasicoccus sp. TK19100]
MNATNQSTLKTWLGIGLIGFLMILAGWMFWETSTHAKATRMNVVEVQGMELGDLSYCGDGFDCYQTDYYRYTSYILHFDTPSFIQKNSSHVVSELPPHQMDWDQRNVMGDVLEGFQDIPYNPDQPFARYTFQTGNSLVQAEALVGLDGHTYINIINHPEPTG